jgi:ABC-2 type transport system permease protein
MKFTNIWEITKKELKSNFDNPSGYIFIGIFLFVVYFLFLKAFFLIGNASLKGLINSFPWVLTILIPAVTMGAFSREKDKQTLEYLITKPISSIELMAGKILGSSITVIFAVLLTLPLIPFILSFGNMDLGETTSGYVGTILLVISLTTIGVSISSLFKNQIAAFLSSAVIISILNLISSSFVSINLPLNLASLISKLSTIDRLDSISRGVIGASDVVYFIMLTIISFAIGLISLEKIRSPKIKNYLRKLLLVLIPTVLISLILIYSSGFAKSRLDLTTNKKYTLSESTKDILSKEGKIVIDVYSSSDLPTQFKSVSDELRSVLNDYQRIGGSNISVSYFKAEDNETKLKEAGIQPVEFNVIGQDKYQIQRGYLGLVIYKEGEPTKKESIPFAGSSTDFEYEITSRINRLKQVEKPKVAFATGNGEKDIYSDYSVLKRFLDGNYVINTVNFSSSLPDTDDNEQETPNTPDLSPYNLLIVADPIVEYSNESKDSIRSFIDNGGNVLYLSSPIFVDPMAGTIDDNPSGKGNLLENYGITVAPSLVYDIKSNLPVPVSAGSQQVLINYPFFIRPSKNESLIPNSPNNLTVIWANSLNLKDDSWKVLYNTSDGGGAQFNNYNLDPQQSFIPENKVYAIAALKELEKGNKVVVLGNSTLFLDDFLINPGGEENLIFGLSLIEYLGSGSSLSSIKAKNLFVTQFTNATPQQRSLLNYGAPAISIIILGALGISRYLRKRRLYKKYALS